MIGGKFWRLSVLSEAPRRHKNRPRYVCLCECGQQVEVDHYHLISGHTTSCGCAKLEKLALRATTHGMSKTPEYKAWVEARSRCNNKKNKRFPHYGGRGIAVCGRWSSFANFYADMGTRPSQKHSLDRIDVNGPYAPENCRWATEKEQQSNRRNNVHLLIDGELITATEASRLLGIPLTTLLRKIRHA